MRWDAARYAGVASVQERWGRALIDGHAWHGDERVLDAGCGDGRLAALLLERVPHGNVVAIDQDAGMIEAATARLRPAGARAKVALADVLSFRDAPFDVVFSNAVFHWILDHGRLFAQLHALLRPGGALLAQCGGHGNLERLRTVTEQVRRRAPFAAHFDGWTPPWHYARADDTDARLRAAGFRDSRCWPVPAPTPFEGPDALLEFLRGATLTPYNACLPPSLHAPFAQAVLDALGPPWSLDYVRLEIRARR